MYDGLVELRQIGRDEWDRYWRCVERANLLQSWEYGDAKAVAENWQPQRFLFETADGKPIGLAQILTRAWPVVGGVARLNRGPLLLKAVADSPEADFFVFAALRALRHEARRRRWWLFYAAPEIGAREVNRRRLAEMGFWPRLRSTPWASARLSLEADEATLFAGLDGKWRNLLRKAQKSGLLLDRRENATGALDTLVTRYSEMQHEKGFSGIAEALLRQLAQQQGVSWRFDLHLACAGDATVSGEWAGMVVSVIHGDTATYLIGSTSEAGRRANANYALLWRAILDAKVAGCRWFDLGGLNKGTPLGVAHFKRGLRGNTYLQIGEFLSVLLSR